MASQDHHNEMAIAGAGRGTFKSYFIGFVLSIILTIIPFWAVMYGNYSAHATIWIIAIFAVIQLLVQLYYFMHLNTSSEQRWNLTALLFVLFMVAVVVIGSMWIMYHLNLNMMYGM